MKNVLKLLLPMITLVAFAAGGVVIASDEAQMKEVRAPVPIISKGKGENCVEATDLMRSDHMTFILHQRDETVHGGIRTSKHSLKECIDCHVQKDEQGEAMPINSKDQFCQGCHEYAAVTIDCFECHATTPSGGKANLKGLDGQSFRTNNLSDALAMGEQFINR